MNCHGAECFLGALELCRDTGYPEESSRGAESQIHIAAC